MRIVCVTIELNVFLTLYKSPNLRNNTDDVTLGLLNASSNPNNIYVVVCEGCKVPSLTAAAIPLTLTSCLQWHMQDSRSGDRGQFHWCYWGSPALLRGTLTEVLTESILLFNNSL